jgi:hypothetical protein
LRLYPGELRLLLMALGLAVAIVLLILIHLLGSFLMKRAPLIAAVGAAAILLAGCLSTGGMAPPTGSSKEALEAYRIYASRCSSHVAIPLVATHTCERLRDDTADLAAQTKALVAALVPAIVAGVREALAQPLPTAPVR